LIHGMRLWRPLRGARASHGVGESPGCYPGLNCLGPFGAEHVRFHYCLSESFGWQPVHSETRSSQGWGWTAGGHCVLSGATGRRPLCGL